ncbi:putative FHA domain-containing protein [Gammaproteobacteria bacterium]
MVEYMNPELRYLRICPQCRHENPEQAHRCQQCGLFIGMEPAVLAKPAATEPEAKPATPENAPMAPMANTIPDPAPAPMTDDWSWDGAPAHQAATPEPAGIELECLGYPTVLTVSAGATIGQDHPQQGADVPVPREINESLYLHRRHCRIDQENGRWWLTAIDQAAFGREFTNPTRINDIPLAPGERRELHEGDLLRLSGLRLRVRVRGIR